MERFAVVLLLVTNYADYLTAVTFSRGLGNCWFLSFERDPISVVFDLFADGHITPSVNGNRMSDLSIDEVEEYLTRTLGIPVSKTG
ncbi:MAG: hypothetical protein KKA84_12010 [Bacteroidetes bacterium]|nr:hypothetical protein [Bacteroidota bacterium]